jgi:hypothetical protein
VFNWDTSSVNESAADEDGNWIYDRVLGGLKKSRTRKLLGFLRSDVEMHRKISQQPAHGSPGFPVRFLLEFA